LNPRIKYIANRIHLDPAQKESIQYARKPVASNAGPAPKKKNSGKFLEKTAVYKSNRIGDSQENPEPQANFPAAPALPADFYRLLSIRNLFAKAVLIFICMQYHVIWMLLIVQTQ